jgi:DNA-binding GntR family transcriptional regulator
VPADEPARIQGAGVRGETDARGSLDRGAAVSTPVSLGQRKLAADLDVPPQRAAGGVLADRMAAALVHREPGWQLPRRSALARRYNASMAEIDAAIAELTRRSLIRGLPDGQFYRASAAEYLIPLEGIGGLSTRLDPMGGAISCSARHVSLRAAPQDVAWSLGVNGGNPVRIVRCTWVAGAEAIAVSTAYVPGAPADGGDDEPETFEAVVSMPPGGFGGAAGVRAQAADLEMAPPQPSVARSLRLLPGQPATSVTIRFVDRAAGTPVGLTIVTLKPHHFRVVIQAGDPLPRAPHLEDVPHSGDQVS